MKRWVPLTLGCVIVMAYAYVYEFIVVGTNGVASAGIVNEVGLLLVFLGIIAVGLILRRASPPK